ncbi:MAG: Maf family protein, partial [Dehalococcoidia bacterium]
YRNRRIRALASSEQHHRLILASGSPRRAEILSESGIELDIVPAAVDEDSFFVRTGELSGVVQELALAKAVSIASRRSGEWVLGADTIVVLDGEVLGKPESSDQAVSMLRMLSGRSHVVITGVAIVDPAGKSHTKHVSTSVIFRSLDDAEIAKYVSTGSPLDKAGGYGIQDGSFAPVASYDECYLNVVGLPMCATGELLELTGFVVPGGVACRDHVGSRVPGLNDSRAL